MGEVLAPVDMFEQFRTMFLLILLVFGGRFLWRIYRLIATDAPRLEIVRMVSELATVLLFIAWTWYGVQFALVAAIACIVVVFVIRSRPVHYH